MENVAKTILKSVKAMVPGRFHAVPATPATHPHVDWNAYAAVRASAAALGLRHLGDSDVTTVYHNPSMMKRPVLAVFVSEDGTQIVGHYRMALRWTPMGILARFIGGRGDFFDVSTYYGGGGGVVLATTNAQPASVWTTPDFILREGMKSGTPLRDVLERHRQRVAAYQRQHPDAHPDSVQTLREIVAMSDVIEQRKLAWRRQLGWATRDELARVSKMSDASLDQLWAAFQARAQVE